jgi:hypothetical protein
MGVRLRLGDPDLIESLSEFLERRECAVDRLEADTLDVALPHELHPEQASLELDLYLRVWQSLHDWSPVEYLDGPWDSSHGCEIQISARTPETTRPKRGVVPWVERPAGLVGLAYGAAMAGEGAEGARLETGWLGEWVRNRLYSAYVADELTEAASDPMKAESYAAGHERDDAARADRLAWLRAELDLGD